MAELGPQSGQPTTLEQEIAQIERDLASKRAALEGQSQAGSVSEMPHEKEILHEVVGEKIDASQTPVPQSAAPAGGSGQGVQSPVVEPPAYLSAELKEKVQELVNIAFTQTIEVAIKQARATNNAAIVDAFHDALVDELYSYLLDRGKLNKL